VSVHVNGLKDRLGGLPEIKVEADPDVQGDEDTGDGRFNTKQQQLSVAFFMADGTVQGALYHQFLGIPVRNRWKDATEVRIYFGGWLQKADEQGEIKDTPGDWVGVITGERLDKIHDELKEGRRISIRLCSVPKEKDGAVVSGIAIEKLEEPEVGRRR
jgi:hypothetical protein